MGDSRGRGKADQRQIPQLLLPPDLRGPRRSCLPTPLPARPMPGPKGSHLARKQQMGELMPPVTTHYPKEPASEGVAQLHTLLSHPPHPLSPTASSTFSFSSRPLILGSGSVPPTPLRSHPVGASPDGGGCAPGLRGHGPQCCRYEVHSGRRQQPHRQGPCRHRWGCPLPPGG